LLPQQAAVELAECKNMLFHLWIPSAEGLEPGLDYGGGPVAGSGSKVKTTHCGVTANI